MKKIIFLFLIVHCGLLVDNCLSQWQPDVRLTNNASSSQTSLSNAWCVAASGSFVHVVWYDFRDGNNEIYYKRSTDGGVSWGTDTRLTNNSTISWTPSVAVSGSVVHVIWRDDRDGNGEIYYKRSTDNGISWGADTRLTNTPAFSNDPSVSVSGSVVHVVWTDFPDGQGEIYHKRSTDGGISWGADTRLTNNPAFSEFSSVAVSGSVVHVVWYDFRDGNLEIYYKRSSDAGISWEADTRLTNNSGSSRLPSISVSGSVVHVVWYDNRDRNFGIYYEIYYKRSTDGGVSWGADTRLTDNPAGSGVASVSVSGSVVHIVWQDSRDGNSEIYYKRSTDGGVSWGADTRLTNNSGNSYSPSVTISGSTVHVVWYDFRDGNNEIYYKRDPTGNPVGIININSEIPKEFSLSQNYPNPFNPSTNIKFAIPKSSFVKLIVYDMLGREVETLVNENLSAGTYNADWSAEGGAEKYSSGVYFYKIQAGEYIDTKKMILVK